MYGVDEEGELKGKNKSDEKEKKHNYIPKFGLCLIWNGTVLTLYCANNS